MNRRQRIAAYNVIVDEADRLLLCRLADMTERPGSWTLPGGGVEFGEHPEVAAIRELHEETGLVGRIVELLAVDSIHRPARADDGREHDYHSVRIVYRTVVTGSDLVHELDGSTDLAQWFTREQLVDVPLLEMGALGVRFAFGEGADLT